MDSAVLSVGRAASSDLWGRRGLHFLHWPQGGAEFASLTHSACSFPANWIRSAAESSWAASGAGAGPSGRTPGSASLLRGARSPVSSGIAGVSASGQSGAASTLTGELGFLRTQVMPEEKVKRRWGKVGRSFLWATDRWGGPSSCERGRAWRGKLGVWSGLCAG